MSLRRIILASLALLAFPVFSAGTLQGYIVYIALREYKSTQTGTSVETGQPTFTTSYTDKYYTLVKYVAETTQPTYQSLGLTQYNDLQGNSPPHPATSEYTYYLVVNLTTKKVTSDLPNVDYSPLGNLLQSKPLTPIYEGTALPYTVDDYGRYSGLNSSFGENGLNILQGRVSGDDGSAPQFYYYDPNGDLVITDSPNTNMGTYSFDPATGAFTYTPWSDPNSGSGSGSVDLTPVVNAINTQGGLTRDQLVSLLGSAGNSWVYDCKLSLGQLYNLAVNSGLIVQVAHNSQLDDISSAIASSADDQKAHMTIVGGDIVSAIEGINVSPVVNVDTSALAKDSTLSAFSSDSRSRLYNIDTALQNANTYLNTIRLKLNNWDSGNTINYSPADFGDTTPDQELPDGFQDSAASFPSSVSQTLGTLTDWGDNGVPSAFDFNPISGLLNTFVGSIPSVGSDATFMEVDFDLPYVGHIQRIYRWSDFPYISEFRQFLLWCLYVFFGIACFKLIHKSIF